MTERTKTKPACLFLLLLPGVSTCVSVIYAIKSSSYFATTTKIIRLL